MTVGDDSDEDGGNNDAYETKQFRYYTVRNSSGSICSPGKI